LAPAVDVEEEAPSIAREFAPRSKARSGLGLAIGPILAPEEFARRLNISHGACAQQWLNLYLAGLGSQVPKKTEILENCQSHDRESHDGTAKERQQNPTGNPAICTMKVTHVTGQSCAVLRSA
jgi:hypothetical protein